jgi:putative adhesin
MRNPLLILTLLTATAGAAATAATQVNNFHWSRTVERGKMVDIRGVNGSVRARASGDGVVHVEATSRVRGSDPQRVDIRVIDHDRGVTICAMHPRLSEASDLYDCVRGGDWRSTIALDNDPEIDFVVGVPVGVRFSASTVNADVEVQGLQSEVSVATISGRVSIQRTARLSASSTVTTTNGDVVLQLPAAAGAEVHASTVSGDLP